MSSNHEEQLADKWHFRFELLVRITFLLPIVIFFLQLFLTGKQLSFDVMDLHVWMNFQEVFKLPLGCFALMGAVTTLVGLYHRSLMLNKQLKKMTEQIEISNKQSLRSEQQLKLALRKESLVMFLEHRRYIFDEWDSRIKQLKSDMPDFASFQYSASNLYKNLYSLNSPTNIEQLTTVSPSQQVERILDDFSTKHTTIINRINSVINIPANDNPNLIAEEIENLISSLFFRLSCCGLRFEATNFDEQFTAVLCYFEVLSITEFIDIGKLGQIYMNLYELKHYADEVIQLS